MAVKGLTPQLAERGKLKIGEKGEMKTSQGGKQFSQPRKLDHFVITTMQRDAAGRLMPDTALMARLKPEGGKITEIPVRLLYDNIDLNFMTRYACYRGNRCWCSGDGEAAQRFTGENGKYQEVPCPCERQDPFYTGPDRCKILGTLQVLIEGTDRIGGVWKYRTTSWNTVNAVLSSLALIKTVTGGPLAGIPLWMVLSPKTVSVPTTGANMVIFVVSLEYRGPEQELAELGYDIAKRRLEHRIKLEHVEAEARRMLLPPHAEPMEEQAETGAEFYPEGMAEQEQSQGATPEGADVANGVAPEPDNSKISHGSGQDSPASDEEVVPVDHQSPPPQPETVGGEGLTVTELPPEGSGVLRVEIGPEDPPPSQTSPKGKKHLSPVPPGKDKPGLF